jgi:outer membrane immunogenic protein
MKKLLLGTVGLLALGMAPASAADLAARPYTKAPPMALVYDWSGVYVGANGGWGQNRDCRGDVTTGVDFGCHNGSGGTGGAQFGYRWQTGVFVFGLEAQGNWAGFKGSAASLAAPAFTERSRMDAFGLYTGQIGYAWNNTLLYAKGGVAVTDTNYDVLSAAGAVVNSTGDTTNWGATAGAGIEYGFAPHWSVAFEYDHIFQNSHNLTFLTPAAAVVPGTVRTGGDTDLATVRINLRFGGPAVIAKY